MGTHRKPSALRRAAAAVLLLVTALGLTSCQPESKEAHTTIFAMDTVMNLDIYGKGSEQALTAATEEIYALQRECSATEEGSSILALDQGAGEWVDLSASAADLLEQGLSLCQLTDGALDLTAYAAVEAWGFISGEYQVPDSQELERLTALIDYTAVEQQGRRARLPLGVRLDLGAVAKGYTGDKLAQLLEERGITSALLDLGQSSIQAVGTKEDGSPWRIGIQDPAGESYLAVVQLSDAAMGTSGGYQRYFQADGVTYWHIIDPATAAPARSGLSSVTVVSSSGLLCDGLSTALFVMGQEAGYTFWKAHPELAFEVIFIADDGSISITRGLQDTFTLAQGYEDREVTVLE
jgi:thiamine biosynthesis lipoprotein